LVHKQKKLMQSSRSTSCDQDAGSVQPVDVTLIKTIARPWMGFAVFRGPQEVDKNIKYNEI